MSAEPTLLASHTSEGRPVTADEKKSTLSKELTPSEHVTLDVKQNSKGIRAFLPWSKKASGKETESEAENAKAADTLAPASFLSLFRYSTRFEIMLDLFGVIFAVAAGASQPLMTLVFGDMTQDFVTFSSVQNDYYQALQSNDANVIAQAQTALDAAASELYPSELVPGIAMLVCTYMYMCIWAYTSEANGKRIRERYLQAILRQEIAYFDDVGAGEVATRIQTDTHLVQMGISEKVTVSVACISSFTTGFILAYARSWRLALALSSMIVCIIFIGAAMKKFLSKYTQLSLKHVAEAGSLAEEVISTIRTAQAFGTQKVMSGMYDKNVDVTRVVDTKASIWQGAGLGCLFFVTYAGYALAFDFGTTLINEGKANAGQVVNVFFAILTGSLSLALLAPELQAITRGCGAAAKLFATIERVPDIDSANPGGLKPPRSSFSYPSRSDVPILKGINITFPAGKTTALVGASGSGKSTIVSLTERFYDPLSGSVMLDGTDLRELNIKWLRSQIGLVSQEPVLFATTISGNVAHGLIGTQYEDASEEENLDSSKQPASSPMQMTLLAACHKDMTLWSASEVFCYREGKNSGSPLRELSSDRTGRSRQGSLLGEPPSPLLIALSTIKDADCILVMGDGLVLERGTHAELLADENGAYSRLVAAQSLREGHEDGDLDGVILSDETDLEKPRPEELLERKSTIHSIGSDVVGQLKEKTGDQAPEGDYGNGAAYPASGIIYGQAISGFSATTNAERSYQGDRNALCFKAILRQDIEYFDDDKNSTGALTSKLERKPPEGKWSRWHNSWNLLVWLLALHTLGRWPLSAWIRGTGKRKKALLRLPAKLLHAIRTVASLTREEHCLNIYKQSLEAPIRKSTRTALWSNLLYAFSQAMGILGDISSRLSTVFSSMQASNFFAFVPDISSAKGAADAIIRLLDSTPAIDAESTEGKSVPSETIKGLIRLENVRFSYPTRPRTQVLRGLSFTVEPGTYVALVGSSGCGKSTVVSTIHFPGRISLDGELIDEFNVQAYRQQIALVSQEPTLYAGTIRFNILLGAARPETEVTQEEIEAACRSANILDFIQSLPDGFNTEVGGKGSQLSGGQKQRIAIARALLRNPKVLLLDEATSALDSNSEKVVQEALDKAAKGRTTIAIAHRLSTIQNADRIHFIKEGRVCESGTHDELLALRGDYYEFVQLQALSKK
ncbi:hypothetical protein DFJ58DRAFT_869178 [Suillus subalutaceus]|uniref:uncharacterized protein n=1 Tax=Suillus subalutaceus TaxID=48586 RepID=UPI001B87BD92|nr:uncharacterized protein DFJ58DRAFT_869178 [Suillus subalutaceus]KAG1834056.1 hypothetical protein DFJ58DRAFT_869178 [Suillus subalutaceus]